MADRTLEDVIKDVEAALRKAGINVNAVASEDEEFDPVHKDFIKAMEDIRVVCKGLLNSKVEPVSIIGSLVVHACEFAYIQKRGYRGPARDLVGSLSDKAFDDIETASEKSGYSDALRRSFEMLEAGDKEGAMKIVRNFPSRS